MIYDLWNQNSCQTNFLLPTACIINSVSKCKKGYMTLFRPSPQVTFFEWHLISFGTIALFLGRVLLDWTVGLLNPDFNPI
jgi:hypothetical protein